MIDATTTSPHRRIPALLVLASLAAYFVACFVTAWWEFSGTGHIPRWAVLGSWDMFTLGNSHHHDVEAEVEVGGDWRPLDLLTLFPSQWDSGPRYVRGPFRENKLRMSMLAYATCQRSADHPARVRLYDVSWRLTIGQHEQPRENVRRKLSVEFDCSKPSPMPPPVWGTM
jgi:hypothetical protein